jgi:hypothetical protein
MALREAESNDLERLCQALESVLLARLDVGIRARGGSQKK